ADARVRVGEARMGGRDQHVAAERQLEAAGDGEAVDPADDGQWAARHDMQQALLATADGGSDLARARGLATQLLQVEPGAEGAARPREDEHVDVAGARQVHEGIPQGLAQLAREGVQRLRAIEGERGDTVDHLDEQYGLRHGEARSTRRAVVSASMGRLAQFVLDFVWATLAERQMGLMSAGLVARCRRISSRSRWCSRGDSASITSTEEERHMTRVHALPIITLLAIAAPARPFTAGVCPPGVNDAPALPVHFTQADVLGMPFPKVFAAGRRLFVTDFNVCDGAGRPGTNGGIQPRPIDPTLAPRFTRVSGPEANSCAGCHNQPQPAGAGDFVANVFVLAQNATPVSDSILSSAFTQTWLERNTLGMFGSGAIELLGREMTEDLLNLQSQARAS